MFKPFVKVNMMMKRSGTGRPAGSGYARSVQHPGQGLVGVILG